MSILDTQDVWKKAANYDSMKIGESVLLIYMGDEKYVLSHGEVADIGNAKSGVVVTKNALGPHFAVVAKAGLMNVHTHPGKSGIEAVDFDILTADAQAELSATYIGAGAELVLAGGSASIFDLKLALGTETGFGIKDDSLQVKVLGTGVSIGRTLGIEVFGSKIAIDFGRLWQ